MDPIAFVRATPPFDALPEEAFARAARALEVSYFPVGTRLVQRDGPPLDHLHVIRKGAVRLERDGQTVQVLEEGELVGVTSLISRRTPFDVVVEEDLLTYRLPRATFEQLLLHAPFAGHFATGLADRLRNSLERSAEGDAGAGADLTAEVEGLLRGPAVWIEADATVGAAARVMRHHGVSSVLVKSQPPAILTDRDLRNRVLAEELAASTPVSAVSSSPVVTISAAAPVYEAWQLLLEQGIHHLAVESPIGIAGVVTSGDLLRASARGPVVVIRRVEQLASRDSLPGYAALVADMARALLAGGLEPSRIAGLVARLNDALLTRILRWGEEELGPPPCPYAWIVFGSEGRMEQTLLTDQDNALVHADDGEEATRYFDALAKRANHDLTRAGFPRCPGGYMAEEWHGPLSEWRARFAGWANNPTPDALLAASIFFDFRAVHGTLSLAPLEELLRAAGKQRTFLAAMAKSALEFKPPPGLLLRISKGSSELDLKLSGISPIVFLARCYGLEAGSPARGTVARLDAAVGAGLIGEEVRANLAEAYRFLLWLRLREQLKRIAQGERAGNTLTFSDLSAAERSRLREAFRAIRDWQETAAFHYRTDLF
ncbi:MAG TPA: DUF294 nucleotidyltransferase-like domain-containing protein [Anaeromyxobacteraceae bacterium]|jgi:CBS domain-containing protein|nr:DUF294 nucleotidyltransferase-like domain-containing protein [Anaeromyxobacteraceae bacterium]